MGLISRVSSRTYRCDMSTSEDHGHDRFGVDVPVNKPTTDDELHGDHINGKYRVVPNPNPKESSIFPQFYLRWVRNYAYSEEYHERSLLGGPLCIILLAAFQIKLRTTKPELRRTQSFYTIFSNKRKEIFQQATDTQKILAKKPNHRVTLSSFAKEVI